MPRRCCCSCRERKDISQLIRLFVDPLDAENHLRVSNIKPPKGRTAWICYESSCINQAVTKNKLLRSSLRIIPNVSKLKPSLISYLKESIQDLLEKIHRSGRIFDPKEKKEKNAQYWISYQTTLAKESKIEYLRWEKVLRFQVILGENPPSHLFSTIGIQSGKCSQQLLQELRLLFFLLQEEENATKL